MLNSAFFTNHAEDEGRGFFVEVGSAQQKLVVLRSFRSAGPLAGCVAGVELPEY